METMTNLVLVEQALVGVAQLRGDGLVRIVVRAVVGGVGVLRRGDRVRLRASSSRAKNRNVMTYDLLSIRLAHTGCDQRAENVRSTTVVLVREGINAYHHAVHAHNNPGRQGPVDRREIGRHKLVLDAARQVGGLRVQLQEVDRPVVEGVVRPVHRESFF